ncbi:MAG: tripartite tricarboxylate transporter permease [Planctomycetota bacterium]|nr:tripartite tricarboxylate transporter permease [Planctomycetota bacterium]
MEGLAQFFIAVASFLNMKTLILLFLSSSLGVIIGALPGLSATMGIALLTGLTFSADKMDALTILMGVYVGAIYGGSITAILINVPGTGSAAATALDGHKLALKGEGANAIKITRAASVLGTFIGMACLATITPIITSLALQFTSVEYFLLATFGVLICGSVSAKDMTIKGWAAGIIGVLIAFIGMDPVQGIPRFIFGNNNLMSGINIIPAMIGFFAFPQIIKTLCGNHDILAPTLKDEKEKRINSWSTLWQHLGLVIRSSAIGVGIGALPGVGENVAAWLAYDHAKKTSKEPEKVGTGVYEGVIAPEVANNAAIGGALIPLLSLAVPGSPPAAVLLGALLLHGIRPGPMLNVEFPTFTYELSALLLLGTFMLWVVGVMLANPLARIITIPNGILMPIVAVLCIIGSYAMNLSMFDLTAMFIFGLLGIVLEATGYPSAAIILGMLLGGLLDENFRRALLIGGGDPTVFLVRPIGLIFLAAILYTLIGPTISRKVRDRFKDIQANSAE